MVGLKVQARLRLPRRGPKKAWLEILLYAAHPYSSKRVINHRGHSEGIERYIVCFGYDQGTTKMTHIGRRSSLPAVTARPSEHFPFTDCLKSGRLMYSNHGQSYLLLSIGEAASILLTSTCSSQSQSVSILLIAEIGHVGRVYSPLRPDVVPPAHCRVHIFGFTVPKISFRTRHSYLTTQFYFCGPRHG